MKRKKHNIPTNEELEIELNENIPKIFKNIKIFICDDDKILD